MPSYPGIYRAKAISVTGSVLTAYVPQVFGDVPAIIENFIGDAPAIDAMGWVSFQGGSPEFPVWHGTSYTDLTAAYDDRYVNLDGDTMKGPLVLPSSSPTANDHATRKKYVDDQDTAAATAANAALTAALAPAWIALPLGSGWSNYGTPWGVSGYRKIGDTVQLRGLVKVASAPTSTIATLPTGYRPAYNCMFTVWASWNGAAGRGAVRLELVAATGVLSIPLTTTNFPTGTTNAVATSFDHVTLDGLSFSTTA